MNRRSFFKALAALPVLPVTASHATPTVEKEVIVKVPLCVDIAEEWHKEQTIPGYISKTSTWGDVDLETGEWTTCPDDDPIHQHQILNEWYCQ